LCVCIKTFKYQRTPFYLPSAAWSWWSIALTLNIPKVLGLRNANSKLFFHIWVPANLFLKSICSDKFHLLKNALVFPCRSYDVHKKRDKFLQNQAFFNKKCLLKNVVHCCRLVRYANQNTLLAASSLRKPKYFIFIPISEIIMLESPNTSLYILKSVRWLSSVRSCLT